MQVDLKPQQLFEYEGISPCPSDIDDFWDDSIKEMESLDFQVELRRTLPWLKQAEAFELYFTGVGGERIFAKYLRPLNARKAPVVFTFHGYPGKTDGWTKYLSYVSQGFCVAALDCRGQKGKSQDLGGITGSTFQGHIIRGLDSETPKDLLFRKVFLDTAQLVRIVEGFEETDENRMYAVGASQGGALALACAALSPQIKKVSAMFPFLCDYKRVWEMDLAERAYGELKDYFRHYDPRHEREDEMFLRLGYIDIQNLAKRIKAEVYMFTGLLDTVCPPSTQFASFNKIQSEKRAIFYPDFGHEELPDAAEIIMEWFLK